MQRFLAKRVRDRVSPNRAGSAVQPNDRSQKAVLFGRTTAKGANQLQHRRSSRPVMP
jgi:hypothetical protein